MTDVSQVHICIFNNFPVPRNSQSTSETTGKERETPLTNRRPRYHAYQPYDINQNSLISRGPRCSEESEAITYNTRHSGYPQNQSKGPLVQAVTIFRRSGCHLLQVAFLQKAPGINYPKRDKVRHRPNCKGKRQEQILMKERKHSVYDLRHYDEAPRFVVRG